MAGTLRTIFVLLFLLCTCSLGAQSWQWAVNCGNSASDKAIDIAVSPGGDIYFCGFYNNQGTFGSINIPMFAASKEAYVAKMDSLGNFIWVRNCESYLDDRGLGLCLDPQGNVIYTGTAWYGGQFGPYTTAGQADHPFIVKLDPSGGYMWAVQGGSTGDDHGFDMVTDKLGNIYISGFLSNHYGTTPGTATFGTLTPFTVWDSIAFVGKLSSNGVWKWVRTYQGHDGYRDNRISIDSSANIYIAGGFYGTNRSFGSTLLSSNGGRDIFVMKYDSAGNFQWVRPTGSTLDDRADAIVVDKNEEIYITGEFRDKVAFGTDTVDNHGGPNGRDIFVAKMKTDGTWIWARRAGSNGGSDRGCGIAADNKNHVYVSGQFKGNAHFGNDTTLIAGTDSVQIFVASIDTSGGWQWAIQAGGPGEDRGNAVACDTSCRVYVTGFFHSSANFPGAQSLTSYGAKDGFVARVMGGCIVDTPEDTSTPPVPPPPPAECDPRLPNIFTPNGDGHNETLALIDATCVTEARWRIFNRWGQVVFETADPLASWDGSLKSSKLSDGVYYYVLDAMLQNGSSYTRTGFVSIYR